MLLQGQAFQLLSTKNRLDIPKLAWQAFESKGEGDSGRAQEARNASKGRHAGVLRGGPLEKLWGGRGIFEQQEFFFVIKFLA